MPARRRKAPGMGVGAFCAIPFLLSLLAHASMSLLASFAAASAEYERREAKRAEKAERDRLDEESARLREEVGKLEGSIAGARPDPSLPAIEDQAKVDARSLEDLERIRAEILGRLAARKAELARLDGIEEKLREALGGEKDIAARNAALREEIARLEKGVAELEQKLNGLEKEAEVPPEKIIQGAGVDALYVECGKDSAAIVPDGPRLASTGASADRDRLLGLARPKGLVFFLIRPDGIGTFKTYRKAVESANAADPQKKIRIGYEPVDAGSKLAFVKVGGTYRVRVE